MFITLKQLKEALLKTLNKVMEEINNLRKNSYTKEEVDELLAEGDFGGGVEEIYIGSGKMPQGYKVQIDPSGEATGVVEDVRVNGSSIVENSVANIPIMTHEKMGVAKYWNAYGIQANDEGYLQMLKASNDNIDTRDSNYRAIVPTNLDYAVKQAMTDGKGQAWTYDEQQNAQSRIGLNWKLLGDITVEEDGVAMVEIPIDNPNYNEYQFYVYVAERKNTTATSVIVGLNGITSTQYALTYGGVGTGSTYHFKGHAMRHCNQGWFTNSLGSADGKPCSGVNSKAVDYYAREVSGRYKTTEQPETINVSLATGLDIGTRFVVYAR